MKRAIQWAYALRRWWLARLRWPTRGVKVIVEDRAGRVLFVRNSYGDTAAWVLPGGGIYRRETPEAAGIREVREETGCRTADMRLVGRFGSRSEGKRDTVWLFRAVTADVPVAEPREIAEARFFALDALPDTLSPATRRRIDEGRGLRVSDGRW